MDRLPFRQPTLTSKDFFHDPFRGSNFVWLMPMLHPCNEGVSVSYNAVQHFLPIYALRQIVFMAMQAEHAPGHNCYSDRKDKFSTLDHNKTLQRLTAEG